MAAPRKAKGEKARAAGPGKGRPAGPGKGSPADPEKRGPASTPSFPRWLTALFILTIGLILWIGVLSNSSGLLTMPGTDAILYVAAVICVAALLAWADRKRGVPEERHKRK
jgi:hypothetical protein